MFMATYGDWEGIGRWWGESKCETLIESLLLGERLVILGPLPLQAYSLDSKKRQGDHVKYTPDLTDNINTYLLPILYSTTHSHESLLYIGSIFCAGFHKWNTNLISKCLFNEQAKSINSQLRRQKPTVLTLNISSIVYNSKPFLPLLSHMRRLF